MYTMWPGVPPQTPVFPHAHIDWDTPSLFP